MRATFITAMPVRPSSENEIDKATAAMNALQLQPAKSERWPQHPERPGGARQAAHAPPWTADDLQSSPAGSVASSSGSVSLRDPAQTQDTGSPTISTASSSGSVALREPAQTQRHHRACAPFAPPLDTSAEAQACLSSTKAPAARRANTAAVPECLSSTKGPAALQLRAAATSRHHSPLGLSVVSTPGLSIDQDARAPIPFSEWLAGITAAAAAAGAMPAAASPAHSHSPVSAALGAHTSGLADAAWTPADAHGEWPQLPRASAGWRGKRAAQGHSLSAGLSPAVEPAPKVAFVDWEHVFNLDQATPCSATTGGDSVTVDGSPPPSSLGCLSMVSQPPPPVPFALWQHGLSRAAASPASPLLSVPFRTPSSSALEVADDGDTPFSGGGGGGGCLSSKPVALPTVAPQPAAAVAAAGALHARAVVASPRPRALAQGAQAGAAGGGRAPGSPAVCRRLTMPASPR
ncbi:hypothetical protein PLESTF_000478600 [Pleodorina starrii]|nr:hypothetical protein PLESTM_001618400 [Pleodorina starrii]GLC66827.1 hypothetical protein PLESTF_000478600 [Pleodorina starrii]